MYLDKELIDRANANSLHNFGTYTEDVVSQRVRIFEKDWDDLLLISSEQREYVASRKQEYIELLIENGNNILREYAATPSWLVTGRDGRSKSRIRKEHNSSIRIEKAHEIASERRERFINEVKRELERLFPVEKAKELARNKGCFLKWWNFPRETRKELYELQLEYWLEMQDKMKKANRYKKKHGTLQGFPEFSQKLIEKADEFEKPFSSEELSYINSKIKKMKNNLEINY